MALPPCNPQVFTNGVAFLIVAPTEKISPEAVESFRAVLCSDPAIVASRSLIDWHYVAGHAVFRVLGDRAQAIRVARLALTAPTFSDWRWEVRDA